MIKGSQLSREPVISKSQDDGSLYSLMLAAIELGVDEFNDKFSKETLMHVLRKQSNTVEDIKGLELLGSTHILNGKFEQGFECWLKASHMRSNPRIPLPKIDLPPVFSQFASPEWTTPEDLIQMKSITERNGDGDFAVFHEKMHHKRELDLVYQAMLVRLRYHCSKSERSNDVKKLSEFICERANYCAEAGVTFLKYALLLFEWDELFASHSLSLCFYHSDAYRVFRVIEELEHYYEGPHQSDQHDVKAIWGETVMTVFKWLATEYEIARTGKYGMARQTCLSHAPVRIINRLIAKVSYETLTIEQKLEYMKYLKPIIPEANGRFSAMDYN